MSVLLRAVRRANWMRLFGSASSGAGHNTHSAGESHGSHGGEPVLGSGHKGGDTIATQLEQATGIERVEYLSELQGHKAFLTEPLKIEKRGTLKEPVEVESALEMRITGCTGFPKGEHDINWMKVTDKRIERCGECGQAFKLKMVGGAHHH